MGHDQSTHFTFKCDALLDQKRFIGSDPVGHACHAPAEFETVLGVLLCKDCYVLFINQSDRITFPKVYGRGHQIRLFNAIIKGMNK